MGLRWTESEDAVLRDMFFEYTTEEIAAALPGRTLKSVLHHAKALGLRKTPEQAGATQTLRFDRELEQKLGEPICDWLRRRYVDEEAKYEDLMAEANVANRTIMRLMDKCGVAPLTPSERAKRMIRDNPDTIDNLVRANHTPEALRKRAKTRHENWRNLQSDNEREFMAALLDVGLSPSPEHPVGRFNIDLAFPSVKLAVELDPLWHKTGDKARKDAMRDAALKLRGWTVLRLETRASTSFNVSKVESALSELASVQPSGVST